MIGGVSILSYRGPLVKTVSMLMRLVGLSRSSRKADKKVADLLLVGEKAQMQESQRLYDVILLLKNKPNKRLSQSLHRLLNALLCPQDLTDEHFACPTDQFIFLDSLTDNGYKTASAVKSLCCKMQFCFRIIYFQKARMEAYRLLDYTPFEPERRSEETAIETNSQWILMVIRKSLVSLNVPRQNKP
jgi:hypothetical protein